VNGRLGVRQVVGRRILRLDSVTSTNDAALGFAERQAEEGTVVVAAEQTLGRGSRGRKWISPAGVNLLFSTLLRPSVPVERLSELAFVAGVAVARYLIDSVGLPARVKWPNDVRVGGKKIAGVLIETVGGASGQPTAVVGVGLNVNWRELPSDIADTATSVLIETGRETDMESALEGIVDSLDSVYETYTRDGFPQVLEAWMALECVTGTTVTILSGEETIRGRAEGIDSDGSLVVRLEDGDLRRVPSAGLIVD